MSSPPGDWLPGAPGFLSLSSTCEALRSVSHSHAPQSREPIADWQLPRGVPRSVWEYATDASVVSTEDTHLAGSAHLETDPAFLLRWLAPPGRVIDLGCGTGRILTLLAQRGFECVGVDLSPFGLAATAQNCRRAGIACDLIRANLCDLGCFAAAAFDAAVLVFATLGMIEGAENRLRALEEVRRLLRRRGRLIVHVHSLWPHWGSPNGRRWLMCDLVRRMARHPRAGDTHHEYRGIPNMYHHVFTKGELLRFLRAAGFAPVATVPLASRVRKGYRHGNECRGWFRHFRATGWLVVAEAR